MSCATSRKWIKHGVFIVLLANETSYKNCQYFPLLIHKHRLIAYFSDELGEMIPLYEQKIQLHAFRNELFEQKGIGGINCWNDNRYVFYLMHVINNRMVCLNESLIKQKSIQKQQNALKNFGFLFIFCFSMNFNEHFLKTCIS